MNSTRPTCQNCPYWQRYSSVKGNGGCRRHAPRPLPMKDHMNWAMTEETSWCGDHPQMPAYIAGLAGGGDALREAVLATVPAMVDHLSTIERREGSNLSVSAVNSLDSCHDQLQALVDLATKETP